MLNLNETKMQAVIDAALVAVAGDKRWTNAIRRAAEEIEANPMMHFDGRALLILSPSSEVYSSNGTCQCRAFAHGQPCWHRAAARLVARYMTAN